jgi:putative ABC transport system substrate-binding protein
MRRRDFVAGLLATTGASMLRAAEPNKVYRLAACKFSQWFWTSLMDSLRQLDYIEGKNLIINQCTVDSRTDYEDIARDIVQAKPDVIVVGVDSQFISQVAKAAYPIPVVAVIPSLAAGLVHNIGRPEGNITGISADAGIEMQGKHLDLLRQAVPSISRIAYLSNRNDWEGAWGHAILEAGRAFAITIIGIPLELSAEEPEYRLAFEAMAQQSAEALIFNGLPPNFRHRELIADLALKYRLPSICWFLEIVEHGHGLLSYAPDYSSLPGHLAQLVDQVLKGTKVVDIPVTQPTKFILAINLKTAKSLELQIPPSLIVQADRVIE